MLGLTPVTDDPLPPTTSAPDLLAHAKGKEGNFKYIPNGIPGVETRLPLLFCNGVEEGRISAERFVELTSTNRTYILPFSCSSSFSSSRCEALDSRTLSSSPCSLLTVDHVALRQRPSSTACTRKRAVCCPVQTPTS